MGSMTLAEVLASSDVNVGKLKVVSMLESLPGVGKVKARKVMDDIEIADNRRVQGSARSRSRSCSTCSADTARSTRDHRRVRTRRGGKGTIVEALVHATRNSGSARSWTDARTPPVRVGIRRRRASPTPRHSNNGSTTAAFSSGPSSSATTTASRRPNRRRKEDVVLEIEVDGAQQVKKLYRRHALFVLRRRGRSRSDISGVVAIPTTRSWHGRRRRRSKSRSGAISPTTCRATTIWPPPSSRCCQSSMPLVPVRPRSR